MNSIASINKEIRQIKKLISEIEGFFPGYLSEQKRKGNPPSCWQLSYRINGTKSTLYIKNKFIKKIRKLIKNHKKFVSLSAKLEELSLKKASLEMKREAG